MWGDVEEAAILKNSYLIIRGQGPEGPGGLNNGETTTYAQTILMKTKNIILIISLAANIVLAIYGLIQQREAEANLILAMENEKIAIEAAMAAEQAQKLAEEQAALAEQQRIKADSAAMIAIEEAKRADLAAMGAFKQSRDSK